MGNPLQRLRYLPWLTLLQAAALTIVAAAILDGLLIALLQVPAIAQVLALFLEPPAVSLTLLAVFIGLGALGVYVLQTVFRTVSINATILWAYIPCLIAALIVKSWLPLPSLVVGTQQASLMALIVGVFLGGWRYWRR